MYDLRSQQLNSVTCDSYKHTVLHDTKWAVVYCHNHWPKNIRSKNVTEQQVVCNINLCLLTSTFSWKNEEKDMKIIMLKHILEMYVFSMAQQSTTSLAWHGKGNFWAISQLKLTCWEVYLPTVKHWRDSVIQ